MNKNTFKILVVIALCLLLIVSLVACREVENKTVVEDIPITQSKDENGEPVSEISIQNFQQEADSQQKVNYKEKVNYDRELQSQDDTHQASPLPENKDVHQKQPTEDTQTVEKGFEADIDGEGTMCTLYVHCKSILQNDELLKENKKSVVPKNGVIYEEKSVSFCEGESVFDVLNREMKNSKIQLEFVHTPIYNSVYIEGIGNLYEFDCGENSGWQYRVNGQKPNYGCSQYIVNNGDTIEFYYSCNFLSEN